MGELRDWSEVSGSSTNNFATSEGGMPENMDYREVNDSARERMAAVKRWLLDNNGTLTAAGGPTAYTLTPNASTIPVGGALPTFYDGMTYAFRADTSSTGACTLAVDGGSPFPIYTNDGVPAEAGDIRGGDETIHLVYLTTSGSPSPRWILINALSNDREIRNINETSLATLTVHGNLWAKQSVEIGSDDGVWDVAEGFPLAIKDESGTAANGQPTADKDSVRRLAIAFVDSITELAGFIGYRSLSGLTSRDMRIQNESVNGEIVLAATDGSGTANVVQASKGLFRVSLDGSAQFEMDPLTTRLLGPLGAFDVIQSDSTATIFGASSEDVAVRGDSVLIQQGGPTTRARVTATEAAILNPGATVDCVDITATGTTLRDPVAGDTSVSIEDDDVQIATSAGAAVVAQPTQAGLFVPSGESLVVGPTAIDASVLPRAAVETRAAATSLTLTAADIGKTICLTGGSGTTAVTLTVNFAGAAGDRIRVLGTPVRTGRWIYFQFAILNTVVHDLGFDGSTGTAYPYSVELLYDGSAWRIASA